MSGAVGSAIRYFNNNKIVNKVGPLLAFLAGRTADSESNIVAFLPVFSPGSSQAFFPVRALFGATSAGEWTGLGVVTAHGILLNRSMGAVFVIELEV
jgi:epoxyqueuosine reductase QueG